MNTKETKIDIQPPGKPGETEDLAGLPKADREAREREELVRQERVRRGLPDEDPRQQPQPGQPGQRQQPQRDADKD